MTEEWFASRVAFFEDYVAQFRVCPEKDRANIDLKRDHSLKVLAEAQMILAGLDPDPETALLARAAALFHDIGRYVQYREFKTFSDRRSRNHGLLGCRELGATSALDGLSREQKAMVRAVVAMHNRRFAPKGLDARLDFMLRVVRDADKLDIFRVMLDHFRPDGSINDVVTLHLKKDPAAYTPELLKEVLSGLLADYDKMHWVNDFKLLVLSWVHDLNFEASRQAVIERGYVERVMATLPALPELPELRETINRALGR